MTLKNAEKLIGDLHDKFDLGELPDPKDLEDFAIALDIAESAIMYLRLGNELKSNLEAITK